jgi:hypothetical protein
MNDIDAGCPLKSYARCQKDRCALWSGKECSIRLLAKSIESLVKTLNKVLKSQ